MKEYCEAFYEEHSDFTFRPFIVEDIGQTLAKKPPWYDDYQAKLAENFFKPETDYTGDDSSEADKPGEDIDEADLQKVVTGLKSRE